MTPCSIRNRSRHSCSFLRLNRLSDRPVLELGSTRCNGTSVCHSTSRTPSHSRRTLHDHYTRTTSVPLSGNFKSLCFKIFDVCCFFNKKRRQNRKPLIKWLKFKLNYFNPHPSKVPSRRRIVRSRRVGRFSRLAYQRPLVIVIVQHINSSLTSGARVPITGTDELRHKQYTGDCVS